MKMIRIDEPRTLLLVLEPENLERIKAGDPVDFDTDTYFYGHKISVVVGFSDNPAADPKELIQHIYRGYNRTAEDGTKPRLIGSNRNAG